MQKSKSKYKHEEQPLQVFKYTDSWWSIFISLSVLAIMVYIFREQFQEAVFDGDAVLIGFAILLGIFYGFLTLHFFIILSTRIEIYEHGIALRYGSTLVYTTWENTAYLERRAHGRSFITGIVTLEEVDQQTTGTWFERLLHHKADMNFIDLGPIPIPTVSNGLFSERVVDKYRLSTTEFGKFLAEYAPHLLERERLS